MSRLSWLTPEDAPGAAQCRTVFIPDGLHYQAAFRGAYLLLCNPENWEEHGAQTPETCADAFQSAFFETLDNWRECEVSGLIIGEIRAIAVSTPPDDWLACDGSAKNKITYGALFAAIGSAFGQAGDNFYLPDLRSRLIVGTGTGTGLTDRVIADQGGEEAHQLSAAEMPAHDHTINHNHAGNRNFISFAQGSGAGDVLLRQTAGTAGVTAAHSGSSGSAGSDSAHENMPPFLAVPYYIYAGRITL